MAKSLLVRRNWQFMSPCPYVPLTQYSWSGTSGVTAGITGCDTIPWNPAVYSLIAAFYAATFYITLEVTVQVFFQFRKKSLYFW
jgi:hypothetical protein